MEDWNRLDRRKSSSTIELCLNVTQNANEKSLFVSQVQSFLEQVQRDRECDQSEVDRERQPEDKPPFLREAQEEKDGRKKEVKNSASSLDAEGSSYTHPSITFNSVTEPEESDVEEREEQPGRHLPCLQIPDFLLPDEPEVHSESAGKSGCSYIVRLCCLKEMNKKLTA